MNAAQYQESYGDPRFFDPRQQQQQQPYGGQRYATAPSALAVTPLWKQMASGDGTPYFVNTQTGATQWETPAGWMDPSAGSLAPSPRDGEISVRGQVQSSPIRLLNRDVSSAMAAKKLEVQAL